MTQSFQTLIQALSWTLLHSLWQLLMIFVALKVVLLLIPSDRSKTRYAACMSAISISVIAFVYTFYIQYSGFVAVTPNTTLHTTLITPDNTNSIISSAIMWYSSNADIVVIVYALTIMLLTIRLTYNIVVIKQYRTKGLTDFNAQWETIFNNCLDRVRLNRRVIAKFSSKVNVPVMMGSIKPIILIPITLANSLSAEEAEAILLHELAHIKRADYLVNILQMLAEIILFYNPFIWLMSEIARKEREHCCDDMVVMYSHEQKNYAKALTKVEMIRNNPIETAMAATGNNYHLLNRIKRIMEMKQSRINYTQLSITVICILMLVSSLFVAIPTVKAQTKDDKKKEVVIKKKVKTGTDEDVSKNSKTIVINTYKTKDSNVVIDLDNRNDKKVIVKTFISSADGEEEIVKEIDIEKIVNAAMGAVNWDSLGTLIETSLESVDWNEIQKEIKIAVKESARAANETGKATKELAYASKEIAEAQQELMRASKELQKAKMAYAKAVRSEKHADMSKNSIDEVLDEMNKDGLIDTEEDYSIEKKEGKLYIDGKKQSSKIYDKYDKLIPEDNVKIKGGKNNIRISIED